MRQICVALLVLFTLVLLGFALTACATPTVEPTLELRSPLWPKNRAVEPMIAPTGYAIPQAVAPQYVGVPTYQYAAPAPCAVPPAPAYTPGYQYAAPPVPQAPCK